MLQADECAWERAAAGGEGEEQGEQDAAQAGAGAPCSHRWYVRYQLPELPIRIRQFILDRILP